MIFEIYKDSHDKFRSRIRAGNGKIVLDGAEGYNRKAGAKRTLASLQALILDGRIEALKVKDVTKKK